MLFLGQAACDEIVELQLAILELGVCQAWLSIALYPLHAARSEVGRQMQAQLFFGELNRDFGDFECDGYPGLGPRADSGYFSSDLLGVRPTPSNDIRRYWKGVVKRLELLVGQSSSNLA